MSMAPSNQLSRTEVIESRIDKSVTGGIQVSSGRGLQIDNVGQIMEVSKMMAVSGLAVPAHLRTNPGACLAVAIQSFEWGINPFALANKSYEVRDRLSYESAIYATVLLKRAPIKGRLKIAYKGDGNQRQCVISAVTLDGETVEYLSPKIGDIPVKNSPLWKGDPDQQLYYYSVRAFARRYFPDVMLGVYTNDELLDDPNISPRKSSAESLTAKLESVPEESQLPTPEAQAAAESQVQLEEKPVARRQYTVEEDQAMGHPEAFGGTDYPDGPPSDPVKTVTEQPAPDESQAIIEQELAESLTGDWSAIEKHLRRDFSKLGKGRTPAEFVKLQNKYLTIVPKNSTVEQRVAFFNAVMNENGERAK